MAETKSDRMHERQTVKQERWALYRWRLCAGCRRGFAWSNFIVPHGDDVYHEACFKRLKQEASRE